MRNLILVGFLASPAFALAAKDQNVCLFIAGAVSAQRDAHAQALATWEAASTICQGDKRCEYGLATELAEAEARLTSALESYDKAGCNE